MLFIAAPYQYTVCRKLASQSHEQAETKQIKVNQEFVSDIKSK